jgi:hypothetical protein
MRILAETRLVDDDGTPLETPREMDARHRSEHMARVRASLEGHRRRHAAARTFPALRGFALAEAAVREGRAEWLPFPTA